MGVFRNENATARSAGISNNRKNASDMCEVYKPVRDPFCIDLKQSERDWEIKTTWSAGARVEVKNALPLFE